MNHAKFFRLGVDPNAVLDNIAYARGNFDNAVAVQSGSAHPRTPNGAPYGFHVHLKNIDLTNLAVAARMVR